MATFNIYSADAENSDPTVVVTLDDSNTEIVEIVGDTSENQEDAEKSLKVYMDAGLAAVDALFRYAGSYGTVTSADSGETLEAPVAAAVEDEVEDAASVSSTAVPETLPDGIMAMTNDAGIVVTLLQKSENGAEYRHGGEWRPVVNPSVFDGLTFVGVDDDSVGVYDNHENAGMLAPVSAYTPSIEGPFWPDEIEIDPDLVYNEETGIYEDPSDSDVEDEEALAASVRLDTSDDLPSAIAAAVVDPDLRWFVERRVAALGLEASLPWHTN